VESAVGSGMLGKVSMSNGPLRDVRTISRALFCNPIATTLRVDNRSICGGPQKLDQLLSYT